MKDIDFDELDRAVNSLMSPSSKDEPMEEESEEQVETLETSDDSEVQEPELSIYEGKSEEESMPEEELEVSLPTELEEVQDKEEPVSETVEAPTASSAPVVSRGRFMDVMRPATREVKRPFPATAVSRQGVTLQPSAAARRVPAEAVEPLVEPTDAQPDLDAVIENFQNTFPVAPSQIEPDTASAVDEIAFEASEDTAPLSSPFLADAKVEKRPLGRPMEAAPDPDQATSPVDIAAEYPAMAQPSISPNKDAQLPEQPLPAEFGSELLSIESGGDSTAFGNQPIASPEVIAPSPVEAPQNTSPAPESIRSSMAASIPQQYKVQPQATGEIPAAGAIYDTQPLAHPAEKKPGWLIVVGIILLIVLGAAGGTAVFYLGLI